MAIVIITGIIHVIATMAGATSRIITVSIAGMTVVIAGTAAMTHIAGIIVRATYGNMQLQSLLIKS
ncbi:hypothetical protein [Advenella kashmirensis]|uniref:hypothetical protein n=1 Tax=Advenella kashmirensis TaxID=310575 RepID=UPI000248F0C1|nr:hypothetical protein [Advenella kashmirensis]